MGGPFAATLMGAPVPVRSLGYLHLESDDISAWERFAGEFLGLAPTAGPGADARYFRMDHFPSRLAIHPATAAGTRAIGFEVLDRNELHDLAARVEAAGVDVTVGSAELAAERQVTGLVSFADPSGNPIEVFYGPVLDHERPTATLVSAFVTGSQGMGHVIVTASDVAASYEFYVSVLGFWERNSMTAGDGEMYFLAVNERHHTLGLLPMAGPGRLIHLMVEAATLDDVGYALDRARELEVPMLQSLGRHTNDHMVSFYVLSPEGYAVELGWGGLRIPDRGPTYRITKGAFWGHHPPTS